MTTIAITTSPKSCALFSESGITDEQAHTMPPMTKIVKQNEWLIAAAGADRSCDVVQYLTKYPVVPSILKTKPIKEWIPWIAKRVVPIIKRSAQEELSLDTKDGVAELPDSELVLVTHGKAFGISASLGVSIVEPYWALGSGGGVALGALAVQYKLNKHKWNEGHVAMNYNSLVVACKHDSYSHQPIDGWLSLTNGKITKCDLKGLV